MSNKSFLSSLYESSDSEDCEARQRKKKKKTHKEVNMKLPDEILVFDNPDKMNHEIYHPGQSILRFPTPFRCAIIGQVNCGKSLIAQNIVFARQCAPPNKFEELYIVHGCDTSVEYDHLEPTDIMDQMPSYKDFDSETNKLLIIDDYDWTKITREDMKRASELFRFGSTHGNLSIIILYQSFFRLPKIIKDMCNVVILYRPHDNDELAVIGRRVGLKKHQILYLFDTYLNGLHDSLMINMIKGAPHKFYKNLYEPIESIPD